VNQLEELRTARLRLTRVRSQDINDVRVLHGDADVMSTLGGVRTVEQTRIGVEVLEQHWNEHGFGPWIAHELASEAFVGMGGLRRVVIDDVSEIEIGYALTPAWWGQGLATELAHAAAHVAFRVLHLPALVSFALPTNVRSRRVMEKVGFQYERDFTYKGHPQVLYRLSGTIWCEKVVPCVAAAEPFH
jgi:RimJ/RimL family protein N-acetyltransferase